MKQITTFLNEQDYASQTTFTKNGRVNIKEEVLRPVIKLLSSNGDQLSISKKYVKELRVNPYATSTVYFTKAELIFLAKTYGFSIVGHEKYSDIFRGSIEHINSNYTRPGEIFLMYDDNEKEYLMILFRRWLHDDQPRSAGEDYYGEDIFYVLGIWEDPLLTDEIIEKIKSNPLL